MENKKNRVRNVPFGKATAVITVSMYNPVLYADGWNVTSSNVEKMIGIKIMFAGNVVETGSYASKLEYNNLTDNFYHRAKLDPQSTYTRVGDKAITPGTDAYYAIEAAIDEMESELAAEFGVKTEKQRKRAREIAEAKEIIEQAKEEGVDNLLTAEELKVWRRNYNNLYNEGGEGYIPERVSKEQYQRAIRVLSDNQ